MKRYIPILLCAALLLTACAPKVYEPEGPATGVDSLDAAVLSLLQEVCDPKASVEENLGKVYDWLCVEIKYRPGTADTSGGFTEELVDRLAEETLNKRKGNCDGEAALTAVLFRRMGCPAAVVTGQFLRDDGTWVDHAWVLADAGKGFRHYDPLYGSTFVENARDCFMQTDAAMEATHTWDRKANPVCE